MQQALKSQAQKRKFVLVKSPIASGNGKEKGSKVHLFDAKMRPLAK